MASTSRSRCSDEGTVVSARDSSDVWEGLVRRASPGSAVMIPSPVEARGRSGNVIESVIAFRAWRVNRKR